MKEKIVFLKYPKILLLENISESKNIIRAIENKEIYYSTEKIDGSNTQLAITKNDYKVGKRCAFIKKKEFPWYDISQKDNVKELIKHIQDKIDENLLVRVFGETFGHKLQRNKYYLDDINFKVFSVFVTDLDTNRMFTLGREDIEKLIPNDFLLNVLKKSELLEISSHLDKKSDAFNIEVKEGDVYHKWDTYELFESKSDGKNKNINFLSVKNKNEEFKEVKRPKQKISLEQLKQEQFIFENIKRYITVNRLNNILSKGEVELKLENICKLIELMKQDIIDEYAEEIVDRKLFDEIMKRKISAEIALLIKSELKKTRLNKKNKTN